MQEDPFVRWEQSPYLKEQIITKSAKDLMDLTLW